MNMLQTADAVARNPWRFCLVCVEKTLFHNSNEFKQHLRQFHCTKEGGSFVCQYGRHKVCVSLPLEGVHEVDYETHVERVHIQLNGRADNIQEEKPSQRKSETFSKQPEVKKWTVYSSTQNLSAVLNDPRRYTREVDFFTRTWGDDFICCEVIPLTLLPNVPKILFEDYHKKFEIRLMNHARLKKQLKSTEDTAAEESNQDGFSNAAAAAALRQAKDYSTDEISQVPTVFMHPTFSLEDPTTFNNVLPWQSVAPSMHQRSQSRKKSKEVQAAVGQASSRKLLQEKLSHYLDIVEVRLAQQIAVKSEDFFAAMSSQDQMQENVRSTCKDVKELRSKLQAIRALAVETPMRILRLQQIRSRYEFLYDKLKLISAIHQTQPTIQLLLSSSDYVSALDLISTSQEVLQLELAGIQCFRHLGSQLSEMQSVIEKMMEAELTNFVTECFSKESGGATEFVFDEQDQVGSVVLGLLRQRKINVIQLVKEHVYTSIKTSIRKVVYGSMNYNVDGDEDSQSAGEYVRQLTHEEWLEVMRNVFDAGLDVLKRVKFITESMQLFLDVALQASSTQPIETENETNEISGNQIITGSRYNKLSSKNSELLSSAADLIQMRCAKLINMRSKGGALDALSAAEFVDVARVIEEFSGQSEKTSGGRQCHNLRSTLLSQAKQFLENFHREKKEKLGLILDNERWKQADVPGEIQALVDSIFEGNEVTSLQPKSVSMNVKSIPYLVIEKQKMAVVGTLLLLIKMMVEYCQCVTDIPMLVVDVMTKLCELMKMYNSRTCQLVLGAGAIQVVGLKTITVKHLALAAQCLEVVILHVPLFKSHFEVLLPPKQYVLVSQFDQILKDYGNHRHEIISKIINLMEELFRKHLNLWEVKPPMPSAAMRNISKQIIKLHGSLSTVFSLKQIESLFMNIQRSFRSCLADKLVELGVTNDGGPQHGLVTSDLTFFAESLSSLHGMKDTSKHLKGLWLTVSEKRLIMKSSKH